jgi:serine/threonine-protein kinase HipA
MSYRSENIIHVSLDFGSIVHKVGRLALVKRRIYFEYDTGFLTSGLQISPFKLPVQAGAIPCEDSVFEGLFGVFNDSLPDGWGRLLLDRKMRQFGIAPEQLTPLDRLAHNGSYGMGALVYAPDASEESTRPNGIDLDRLAMETRDVLAGDTGDVLTELLTLSGSSAGARPKVMVGISQNKKHLVHGQQHLPSDFTHWMIKFASNHDAKDIGAIEYAYSLMARAAGIEMMPTHLFPGQKGAGYFGVERFDRRDKTRVHIHTVSGLIHADHRLPSLDYEQILRVTLALTQNMQDVEKMLRLATFNVFAHNRDDHAKNFSFLMNEKGHWRLSPAYDLTFSGGPGGEHSTTLLGEGKSPGKEHLLRLAEKFSIPIRHTNQMIDEVTQAIKQWPIFAADAGVSYQSKTAISKVIMHS